MTDNVQNCMGERTSLTVQRKLAVDTENRGGNIVTASAFQAVLWAEDDTGRSAVQWAIGHGETVKAALIDLDRRLTGLTYADVMRS